MTGVAALLRSSCEDCHQARRELLARKERAKLEKRTDDDRPRLLTEEEEVKVFRGQRFQGKRGRTTTLQDRFQPAPVQRTILKPAPREKGRRGRGKGTWAE